LILSLPIDGFKYGFLRMLRLFAIYTGFVLLLLYFIYSISDGDRLEYGIVDIFLIAGALFFCVRFRNDGFFSEQTTYNWLRHSDFVGCHKLFLQRRGQLALAYMPMD